MNKRSLLRLVSVNTLAVLALSGCAGVQYDCPLGEECVGTKDAYEAAARGGGTQESVFEQDDVDPGGIKPEESSASEAEAAPSPWSPAGAMAMEDSPVYQPPQPVRVWIAPWRDQDNHLRSGQYIYAVRDGGWSMGEMRNPGAGANLLRPSAFTPPENADDDAQDEDAGNGSGSTQGSGARVQPEQRFQPQEGFDPRSGSDVLGGTE